jgi:FkbH-like protein
MRDFSSSKEFTRPSQGSSATAAEAAVTKAEWGPTLFAELPRRNQLLRLKPSWPLFPLKVRVHRNHAFEHVASVAGPWFAWWQREPAFIYSDYDDSLAFTFKDEERADLEVVWLDLDRYRDQFNNSQILDWLAGRFIALRARTPAPIVVALTGADHQSHSSLLKTGRIVPGLRVADMLLLEQKLGEKFYDLRAAKFSGTRLSDCACMVVAREMACHWAPGLLAPRLKAIAVDLDHTLYEGVLGEDAMEVRLTPGHKELQKYLVELRKSGLLLALVSRNEQEDVKNLLERRTDFPLRPEYFSATAVSWEPKADGIRRVAQAMHIGLEAVLFVDDNPGELAGVVSELPMVSLAHANADPALTRRVLEYYPGLWTWETGIEDGLRATDLAAHVERKRLVTEASDPMDYLRTLQVTVSIEINPSQQLSRLHELSQKTNQFNLSLERFSEVDLARLLSADDHRIALIRLRDRLSDSGAIGLVVARKEGDILCIRELAVSCRALGRRLEDFMIAQASRELQLELACPRVEFLHRTGPRNGPARDWLSRLIAQPLPLEGRAAADQALSCIVSSDYPVTLEIKHHARRRD